MSSVPGWHSSAACARARSLLALGCTMLLGQGCSYLFVDAAPMGHAHMRDFDCTTSLLMPVGDAGLVTVLTYSAFDTVLGAGEEDRSGDLAPPVIGSVVLATVAAASAAYGFMSTDQCRGAKGALARRSADEADATARETPAIHR
jgi:hypothetical protein